MARADSDRLGPYRLVDKLASGGMATVHLAERLGAAGFARTVALKVVHPHLADQVEFTEMFLDEARLSARIDHPNVVRVDDFGNVDGRYFLAMEYVRGQPLAAILGALSERGRQMAPHLSVWIATQVAEGLHAAHEATDDRGLPLGLVHRDVSPQNVMVSYDGHVKVLDFGVAKAEGRVQLTRNGSLKGKLAYMSPEQAWSRPVDRRADVFALGVVLWELLTGKRLFRRDDDVETLLAVREARVRLPRSAGATTTPSLDAVVMAALERDVAKRPESALAFSQMLLDACPEARSVRARDVSLVMHTLFEHALERDTERARDAALHRPSPLDDTLVTADRSDEQAFQQLTQSVPVPAAPAGEASTRILTEHAKATAPRRARRFVAAIAVAAACVVAAVAGARFLGSDDTAPTVERAPSLAVSPPAIEQPAEPAATPAVSAPVEPAHEADDEPAVEALDPLPPRARSRSRPRRATRAAPAAGPPGRLTVATVPWATIEVDGRPYGQTPRTIELSPGPHTVVLRAEGASPTRRLEVTVPPGGVVARRVTFEP